MANIIKDIGAIQAIFHQAAAEGGLVEVVLPAEGNRTYGARLLPTLKKKKKSQKEDVDDILSQFAAQVGGKKAVDQQADGEPEPFILLTPLEPADGNLKIRRSKQVHIAFFVGLHLYKTISRFKKVQPVEGGMGIQLDLPDTLKHTEVRNKPRVEVPESWELRVTVQKRGCEPITAHLQDLSEGGLSFTDPGKKNLLQKGDKVTVSIHGPVLQGTPLSTFGTICRIAAARHKKNLQTVQQQIGVQFKMLPVTDAVTVDRLVKLIQKGVDPKKAAV